MNGVRGSAYTEPEWVIMSPADWEIIRLLKDTAGQYLAGGPSAGAYGATSTAASSGQVTGVADRLWNKPVYVTSALGAGTAIVGNSQAATVYNKGALTLEVSNAHSDWFQRDLVAIRAERRLALCVFRPQAFCEVRLS
jgi:HK97 family phage major capsid protein